MTSDNQHDIFIASVYGTRAHINGKKRVPFHDKEFMKWLTSKIINKPVGTSVPLLKAWNNSWDARNLNT